MVEKVKGGNDLKKIFFIAEDAFKEKRKLPNAFISPSRIRIKKETVFWRPRPEVT